MDEKKYSQLYQALLLWEARKNLPFFRLMKYNVSNKLEV